MLGCHVVFERIIQKWCQNYVDNRIPLHNSPGFWLFDPGTHSRTSGCASALARSASTLLLAATATPLHIKPDCLPSSQALFHVSKLLSWRFRNSYTHSARNLGPSTEFTMSCSTRGMSPDMVIFPWWCHAGSYCTGAIRQESLRCRTCAATTIH